MFTILFLLLILLQRAIIYYDSTSVETPEVEQLQSIPHSVLVVGIVRDIAAPLRYNIMRMMKISPIFQSYQMFIYENDSSDGTVEVLREAQERYGANRFRFTSQQKIDPYLAVTYSRTDRYEKMAAFRNQYIQELRKAEYNHVDYVMVFDFDTVGMFSCAQLIRAFQEKEWDALFGMAQINHYPKKDPLYRLTHLQTGYDSLAFVSMGGVSGKTLRPIIEDDDPLLQVKSAFNGLAIYPRDILMKVEYSGRGKCEHIRLHEDMWRLGHTRTFIAPYLTWCHNFN